MDPASITGLISFSIDCTILIYKYIKGLKDASETVSQLQNELDSLRTVLGLLESTLQDEEHVLSQTSALFQAAKKCNHDLKGLKASIDGFSKGHCMRRFFHRIKWPLDEAATVSTTESLHRYLTIFQLSLTAEGISLLSKTSTEVRKKLESLDGSTVTLCTNVEEVKQAVASVDSHVQHIHHEQEYARFLDWLPTINYQEKHLDIESRRLEGSGQWLLNGRAFRSWCEDGSSNSTLFCHGGPGVGKTFLTSLVIDYLQGMCEMGEDKIAYLYVDYKRHSEQNAVLVASCLLKQILCQYPSSPKPALELFKKFQEKKALPQWSTIRSILIETCSDNRNGKHFIVIDALDEYDKGEDRGEMLKLIRELRKANVRLFATSRPFPDDIMNCFTGASTVEVGASESDLVGYIEGKIHEATQLRAVMKKKLVKEITNTIVEKAQGMFLLASLQIDYVLGQTTANEVRKALKCLPSGLWANFQLTMERIQALPHQPQRDLAMRTLLWISHCMRLLSVEELQDAVAISPGAKYIDEGDIVPEALLVEYCCGLVTVDSRTQTIRLAHYSIYEYFHQYDQSSLLGVPHLFITKACLSYLEMDVCRLLFRATESPPHRGFPLLAYAAQHWGDHANMCQADDIRTEVKQFLQDTDAISAWALHGLEEYQNPEGSEPRVAPLHIVARFGLLDVYFSLSAESGLIGEDFNCKTPQGETPLIIASKYGQQAFVEFLLSGRFGVQINDLDFSGRSSLLWAVINGHLGVVKALATNPLVDVNEGYPLLAAVKAREVDICAVLIKRDDLDMNATNNDGDTVFSLLLLGDSLNADLARVLLERVDLDPRQQRAENMIWMLQKDEDIMTNEELETLPLVIRRLTTLCVRRSHLENTDAFLHWFTLWICGSSLIGNHSVILLGWLNEGFEYTASDEMGFNLLHAAVISDNVELLKKALELGLSPNDATKDGETALHLATRLGHDAITLFLLSNAIDINVNAMDNEGWTPLLSTPETGREVTLRMLLESGAEANQVDDKGQSPLLFTAWNGNSDAMLLLTEHGADINRGGPGGWSPLHAAAFKKHLNVCRILVEHGAEVDRNSKLFGTPLGVAAEVRVANIVELLVQHGADPTKLGPYGRTPLEWACSYEPVFRAMGPACLSYQPTPKARAMMVLRETIGNILEELVDGAPQYGVYNVLGHTLSYLGNHQDAITAYKMAASWDHDADVFHGGFECTVCSTIMVGVRWICEVCPAVDLCSSCFAKRPIGNSTSEGAKDVTNSIPWCTSDHDFIEVPSPACVRLSKASAADKGASKAWLQSIWEKYPREAERST